MELITFFVVIIIFMILDNSEIKKDINASRKIKWTKKDSEQYYNKTFNK